MNQNDSRQTTLRRVLAYIGRYRLLLGLSLFLAAISVALTLYAPILVGRAIDQIIGPNQVDYGAITAIMIIFACAVGGTAVCQWLMNMINNRITFHVIRDVRDQAFETLMDLPLNYIDRHATGDLVSRVIADVDQFADGLLLGFTQLFTGVLTILGTLGFMFAIHPGIALVVIILTPLSLLVSRFIARQTYRLFKEQSETRGEQTTLINDMVGGQKVVQAFSHGDAAQAAFDRINERLAVTSLRATFYSSITNPATRFINSLVYAGVAFTGARAVIGGMMSVGQLTCFLSYANQYTKPFNEISGVVTELQNALACAARIFDLIDEPRQLPESPNAITQSSGKGRVVFDGVDFSYSPERPLIRSFNLQAEPGQRIAIVGPTGCGKTTLINLLMRFYDVDSGAIFVDEVDVRMWSRQGVRKQFGMVLQETWLTDGTIRENIALGRPDASDEDIRSAAIASYADGFIRRLPKGYDTEIRAGGEVLSQGQRQLLCIARVMLCRPQMLILDEATSSIDTRTEVKIQAAFDRLMAGRTSFIVAHRLSTIQQADCIVVMQDGQIIEQGNHKQLLEQNGFYTNLYNSQFTK